MHTHSGAVHGYEAERELELLRQELQRTLYAAEQTRRCALGLGLFHTVMILAWALVVTWLLTR